VGSGNLHNKLSAPLWHRLRGVSSSMRTSLSTLQGSRPRCARRARLTALVAGRAASLLARGRRADEHHGPLAQLVRAHG
jgi:hypothetical protein